MILKKYIKQYITTKMLEYWLWKLILLNSEIIFSWKFQLEMVYKT